MIRLAGFSGDSGGPDFKPFAAVIKETKEGTKNALDVLLASQTS